MCLVKIRCLCGHLQWDWVWVFVQILGLPLPSLFNTSQQRLANVFIYIMSGTSLFGISIHFHTHSWLYLHSTFVSAPVVYWRLYLNIFFFLNWKATVYCIRICIFTCYVFVREGEFMDLFVSKSSWLFFFFFFIKGDGFSSGCSHKIAYWVLEKMQWLFSNSISHTNWWVV